MAAASSSPFVLMCIDSACSMQGGASHTLLGRCEILSEDVAEKVPDADKPGPFFGKLCRFPLFYEVLPAPLFQRVHR
jgi:hypothetical protein